MKKRVDTSTLSVISFDPYTPFDGPLVRYKGGVWKVIAVRAYDPQTRTQPYRLFHQFGPNLSRLSPLVIVSGVHMNEFVVIYNEMELIALAAEDYTP